MVDEIFALGGDLPVRRLGFGTGGLVGPGYWGPRGGRAEARALLRTAVERGVTLIDTADNYGPDLAEELIAEALHPYGEQLVIATKGGVVRTGPDQWHVAGRPEQLREMCEASLRRLRVERIGLYQLHRFDPSVPMAEQLGALADLRAEGKIRHIGLDTVTAGQLRSARESVPVAAVQNAYNLLDRGSAEVLALCEAHQIAFLPYYPLGSGSLTRESAAAVSAVAAAHGASPGQVALAWLLHRSPVLCPTPGTGSPAHLAENLDAATVRLTARELELLDALG
ncbi:MULTISPECIES: aldo/keto reductase [unclassified Streptomyces]|uniref:aldo/keto reductase n=1 Tax=unclassified Streptomyces TaxID=2593676 RepID=UPI00214BD2BA|nr:MULTISPECIES: aldo/keto reductase [unclassified Streptomyces]MCX5611512.1 aldo/keto reductase [Streptomyces sp. NBC_00047]UUU39359.1 aldo/keto reductase [Streptomyces sp. NBC_00162]